MTASTASISLYSPVSIWRPPQPLFPYTHQYQSGGLHSLYFLILASISLTASTASISLYSPVSIWRPPQPSLYSPVSTWRPPQPLFPYTHQYQYDGLHSFPYTHQYQPDGLHSLDAGGEEADALQPQTDVPETDHQQLNLHFVEKIFEWFQIEVVGVLSTIEDFLSWNVRSFSTGSYLRSTF